MISLKKFIALVFIMTAYWFASAQNIKAIKSIAIVEDESMDGFSVMLTGRQQEVMPILIKYLKTFGLTKGVNPIMLYQTTINGTKYTHPIYGLTTEYSKTTKMWLGIKTSNWPPTEAEMVNKELEKMVNEFAVEFNRNKLQAQVDESNHALQIVEKKQQNLIKQNIALNAQIEDNKGHKIQLEKALESNKIKFESLLRKLDENKKAQDSIAIANQQIKKVIEAQKGKLQEAN